MVRDTPDGPDRTARGARVVGGGDPAKGGEVSVGDADAVGPVVWATGFDGLRLLPARSVARWAAG